jgi:hypothetical protein
MRAYGSSSQSLESTQTKSNENYCALRTNSVPTSGIYAIAPLCVLDDKGRHVANREGKFTMTIYPVLLAGGSGTRLWPLSRKSCPKQFSKLMGEESLFQASARRLSGAGFR